MNVQKALINRFEVTALWGLHPIRGPYIRFVLVLRGSPILYANSLPQPLSLRSEDLFIHFGDPDYYLADQAGSKVIDCKAMEGLGWDFG
jgi:Cupin